MINFINKLLIKYTSFNRMKHSNIIYDPLTKMTLIDNSLIKALEIAEARKIRIKKNKQLESEKQKTIEMSESHDCKPFFKK
jgi:hypothetical protein